MKSNSSSVGHVAKQLLAALLDHANPRAARQAKAFFKEPVSLVGINAPTMRRVVREIHSEIKATLTPADALAVCDTLMPDERVEVKIASLILLSRFGKKLSPNVFVASQRWIEAGHCNCWAVIDELGIDILGPMLLREPEHFALTRRWHLSANMWLRRAAMVVLVKPARRGVLLDESYGTAKKLLNDPEDLVQKAVGWLLREAGKTDMDRLEAYLNSLGNRCARTTLRYAIERFPEKTRRRLLAETRAY